MAAFRKSTAVVAIVLILALSGCTSKFDDGSAAIENASASVGRALELRAFLDRSVLEVFADGGRTTFSRIVMPSDTPSRIAVFAEGGRPRFDARFWEMDTVWPESNGSEGGFR